MTLATHASRTLGWLLLALLVLPVVGLFAGVRPAAFVDALGQPSTRDALAVSLGTSSVAMLAILGLGTPLAWRLSRGGGRSRTAALTLVELPVVLPPAVLGVALLETFGRAGWLGPALQLLGIQLSFSVLAVVLAQILVGAPLFVLTATEAFRTADDDLLLVARTLGATPARAWLRVALPAAGPGLLSAAALAWARALGEFGATLFFAGNLPGRTQTLPLAIYGALERGDMDQARAISVVLVGLAVGLLLGLRGLGGPRAR